MSLLNSIWAKRPPTLDMIVDSMTRSIPGIQNGPPALDMILDSMIRSIPDERRRRQARRGKATEYVKKLQNRMKKLKKDMALLDSNT